MADSNYVLGRGYTAAAAVTKNRAVKFSAAETVTPVTGITDVVAGVAEHSVSAAEILKGKQVTVQHAGIVEMEASAALAVGALVGISANGRAAAAGAGVRLIGVVVGSPATNAGDQISVLLTVPGVLGVGA